MCVLLFIAEGEREHASNIWNVERNGSGADFSVNTELLYSQSKRQREIFDKAAAVSPAQIGIASPSDYKNIGEVVCLERGIQGKTE